MNLLTATTSLHVAAKYGNVKITELLLNSGDSSTCLDSSLQTPLHLAAASGQYRHRQDPVKS